MFGHQVFSVQWTSDLWKLTTNRPHQYNQRTTWIIQPMDHTSSFFFFLPLFALLQDKISYAKTSFSRLKLTLGSVTMMSLMILLCFFVVCLFFRIAVTRRLWGRVWLGLVWRSAVVVSLVYSIAKLERLSNDCRKTKAKSIAWLLSTVIWTPLYDKCIVNCVCPCDLFWRSSHISLLKSLSLLFIVCSIFSAKSSFRVMPPWYFWLTRTNKQDWRIQIWKMTKAAVMVSGVEAE